MKTRDARTQTEIQSHMAKAKASVNIGMPFTVDEYCCLICNAYFTNKIFQDDLPVIEDLIQFFRHLASLDNVATLEKILLDTDNLKNNMQDLCLLNDFEPVLQDEVKNKLRSLHKLKINKDSRVKTILGEDTDNFYAKYSRDLDSNWIRNAQRFASLSLIKKSRILDIGSGFGFFSKIATFNGHKVDSLDIPNASPILKAGAKLLNVRLHEFTIKKNKPLLKFNHKFDVVTAFQIVFNEHTTKNLWNVEDWKYFLMDIHDNVLADGGSIVLAFNMEHKNLIPTEVDGEVVPLGTKALEVFFNPFFIALPGMHRSNNYVTAVLTKANIKMACQSQVFKKQSYSIDIKASKYGA